MALELVPNASPADSDDEVTQLRIAFQSAQQELRSAPFGVLVLLAGDDRRAVEKTMRSLNLWMDPRNLRIVAFDRPTDDERARPRFWRYWRLLPARGALAVFLGGWTMSSVQDRREESLDRRRFERVLEQVEATERMLAVDGMLILKFWFSRDGRKRGRRHRLLAEARAATDSRLAPWHVVEKGRSRARRAAVARAIVAALRARLAGGRADTTAPPRRGTAPGPRASNVLDAVDLSRRYGKDEYSAKLERWRGDLRRVSRRARRRGIGTVLVFEGWDAAGKGGVIRRLSAGLDPPSYRVVPVAAPSSEERAHHYLWRFWRHLPAAGRVTIFDRSWYGRVLVERVEGFADESEWRRAYDEINEFETALAEDGLLLLKFWLHIDPEEQLRRFRERKEVPYKNYKITEEDWRNRERWDDYRAAVHDMVVRTSRDEAPWVIVPANDKRWARVRVIRTVCRRLRRRL